MVSKRLELKERLLTDRRALEAEVAQCLRQLDPERIILFGSTARGEADPFSDVDVVVVMRTAKRFLDRLEEAYSCWTLPLGVDILVYTPEEFARMVDEENPFLTEVLAHGRTVYERSSR